MEDPAKNGIVPASKLLEDFVVAQMVCAICRQQLRVPIRHCIGGHVLCGFCFFNSRNCPCCGCAKNDARAYMIEKIILKVTFTCKWAIYGCKETHTGKTIGDHENICEFHHMPCPLRFDTNCDHVGTKSQVAFHSRIFHPLNSYSGNQIELISIEHFRDLNPRCEKFQRQYYTFYVEDEVFRAVWEIKGSTARFSLNKIGQLSRPEKKFIFEVGFINKINNRIALRLSCDCVYLNDDRMHFLNGQFVSAEIDSLKRYCGSNGALNFIVKIHEAVNGIPTPLNEYDWTIELFE